VRDKRQKAEHLDQAQAKYKETSSMMINDWNSKKGSVSGWPELFLVRSPHRRVYIDREFTHSIKNAKNCSIRAQKDQEFNISTQWGGARDKNKYLLLFVAV